MYQHRAAKERLERTARQTERATRDAYLAVNSEISRVKALKQALKSTQTALQATEAGFEVGTRTTVDVLEGRRQLYQAETNYARSRYDYIVNVLKLKEAAGTLGDAGRAGSQRLAGRRRPQHRRQRAPRSRPRPASQLRRVRPGRMAAPPAAPPGQTAG